MLSSKFLIIALIANPPHQWVHGGVPDGSHGQRGTRRAVRNAQEVTAFFLYNLVLPFF